MNEIQMSDQVLPFLDDKKEGVPGWVKQYKPGATPMLAVRFRKKLIHIAVVATCQQIGLYATQRAQLAEFARRFPTKTTNVVVSSGG